MARYQERYEGCVITIVTEIANPSEQSLRRIKSALITRGGVNLNYEAPRLSGPDDAEIVQQAFLKAKQFLRRQQGDPG